MYNFDALVQSHGEVFVQYILENWERSFQVKHSFMTLEERWAFFISQTECSLALAA